MYLVFSDKNKIFVGLLQLPLKSCSCLLASQWVFLQISRATWLFQKEDKYGGDGRKAEEDVAEEKGDGQQRSQQRGDGDLVGGHEPLPGAHSHQLVRGFDFGNKKIINIHCSRRKPGRRGHLSRGWRPLPTAAPGRVCSSLDILVNISIIAGRGAERGRHLLLCRTSRLRGLTDLLLFRQATCDQSFQA